MMRSAALLALLLLAGCCAPAAALRVQRAGGGTAHASAAAGHLGLVSERASGSKGRPSLFCFMVVKPRTHEVDLLKLHLSGPMLSACDGYKVYTNESFAALNLSADARQHVVEGLISGGMDSPMEGWPPEKPVVYSASNTAVFLQAWHSIWQSGIHERFDWIVKVDPDTIFFPDRLRLLMQDQSPDEPFGLFDSDGLCSGHIGGIAVISRAGVEVLATREGVIPGMNITREDGMLKGSLEAFGKGYKPERNLILNPVPGLDCSKAPWKVAYHPFKAVSRAGQCLNDARRLEAPIPRDLRSKCT